MITKDNFWSGLSGLDKTVVVLLVMVSITISLPIRLSAFIIVLSILPCLILFFKKNIFSVKLLTDPLFLLISLQFLLLILGLIYSTNRVQGFSILERSVFSLIFPLLIVCAKTLRVSVTKLLISFSLGCLSLTIYGFVYIFVIVPANQWEKILEFGHLFYTDYIFIHPIYLSVYLIIIFFFLTETLRIKWKDLSKFSKIMMIACLLYIIGILFFLKAQMGLLIFSILLITYIIIVFKKRAWLVTFILFTIAFLVFLLDSNRILTFFDTYGKNVSSALDQRIMVWNGTIEGIKTAPFFGAGTGGEQQLINDGYTKTGYQEGINNSYNAHNQYLQFLARNGVLELLCFIILLFYSFRQSLKMSNYTFLMFNMAVTLIMFTESFLTVQKGIVFFYFFVCAFIYLPSESEERPVKE